MAALVRFYHLPPSAFGYVNDDGSDRPFTDAEQTALLHISKELQAEEQMGHIMAAMGAQDDTFGYMAWLVSTAYGYDHRKFNAAQASIGAMFNATEGKKREMEASMNSKGGRL